MAHARTHQKKHIESDKGHRALPRFLHKLKSTFLKFGIYPRIARNGMTEPHNRLDLIQNRREITYRRITIPADFLQQLVFEFPVGAVLWLRRLG